MKHRVIELDALRGIASVMVVIFHFSVMAGYKNLVLQLGVTGVDLFFLISGYVIFMTLSKTKTAYQFIVSRFSRLWPAYLVMMSITLLLIHWLEPRFMPGLQSILANLTMMQPWFFTRYIDDSYWTLTVELQFYVLMLLIFLAGKLKHIETIGIMIVLLILPYYIWAFLYHPDGKLYILPRTMIPLISHFQLFFAGILFYSIRESGANLKRLLALAGCFAVNLFMFNKSGRAHFFIGLPAYVSMLTLYFFIFSLFVAGKLKFLNFQVLRFLGAISYSLYLIHQETGKILYTYLQSLNCKPLPALGMLFLLMIAISSLVTFGIERPAIHFIRKSLLKPQVPASL